MKPHGGEYALHVQATRALRRIVDELGDVEDNLDAQTGWEFRAAELTVTAALASLRATLHIIDDDLPDFEQHRDHYVEIVYLIWDDEEATALRVSGLIDHTSTNTLWLREGRIDTTEYTAGMTESQQASDPVLEQLPKQQPDGTIGLFTRDIFDVETLRMNRDSEPLYPEDVIGPRDHPSG